MAIGFVAGRGTKGTTVVQADRPPRDLKEDLDLRIENGRLRARVVTANEERFEHNNGLHSTFENCREKDGESECSAFTGSGAPVSYHCDIEACALDCGAIR